MSGLACGCSARSRPTTSWGSEMGLITGLFGLAPRPLRGSISVAERVLRAAEDEYYDPARIRAQIEEVDRMRDSGELTDEEATAYEDELVERLLEGQARHRRED